MQGDLRLGVCSFALHVDDIAVQRCLVLIDEADELTDAALVAHLVLLFLALALILGGNEKPAVEKGLLTHTGVQNTVIVNRVLEHLGVGLESHGRAGTVGFADYAHLLRDVAS